MSNYPPGVTGAEPQITGYPDEDRAPTIDELNATAVAFLERYGHHLSQCPAWRWTVDGDPALAKDRHGDIAIPPTFATGKPCTCGMVAEFYDLLNEVGATGYGLSRQDIA